MKIGDKVICKKTCKSTEEYIIKKNDVCKIINFNEQFVTIDTEEGEWAFFLSGEGYIWDYFYTVEEMRKLKLEKLKEYPV